MNKTKNKFNFKAFIMLLMAIVLSLVLCFATACGGDSSDSTSTSESESSSETETVNDTQMIANGNFELYVPKTATYPYTLSSTVKWSSRTTYGTTKSSGIIDTSKDAYKDITLHEGAKADETKLLMFANDVNSTTGEGSAQYTTSSTTITAEYGVDYKLTVWVLTKDVAGKYADNNPDVKTGAYIEVKNTVGQSIQSTIVDNIDTKGEWKQYTIYLRPSNYATTKYQVVLGFGHGSSDNKLRGCSGYAYFDDVVMDKLEAGDFDKVENAKALNLYNGEDKTEEAFVLDTTSGDTAVKVDFTKAATDSEVLKGTGAFNDYHVGAKDDNSDYTVKAPENGELTIDFSQAKREWGASYSFTTDLFDLEKYVNNDEDSDKDYKGIMISFIANVTAKSYSKNASVKVLDNGKENGGFDSFATDGKDVRYAIYLTTNRSNGDAPLQYQLKITFGPTSESSVNTDFPIGKAVFKDFTVVKLNEEEFNLADTSNNGTKVTLLGDYNSDTSDDDNTDDETKDSYTITTGDVMYNADKKDANGRYEGYKVSVDQITGGAYKAEGKDDTGNKAILVNSAYNYSDINGLNAALDGLKKDYLAGLTGDNKEVQAIALYSVNGYYIRMTSNGLPVTVAKNSVYSFSVKLRVIEGEAFVRLYDYDTTDINTTRQIAKFVVNGEEYEMSTKITADTKKELDGYTTVTFIVRTGDNPKNFELQFGFEGFGSMLIGSANKGATYSSASDYDTLVKAFSSAYDFEETKEYTKTVKYYTDEDKTNPVKEEDADGNKIDKVVETTDVVVSYGSLKNAAGEKTNVVMFYRYDTIESVDYVIEADDSSSDSTADSDSTSDSSTAGYAWLQIVSIIIAVVLVAALVAVIIRMATKNKKSKKSRTEAYYQKGYDKSKRYSGNGKNTNKNNIEAPDATDEAYDYGDGENGDGEKKD